MRLIPIGKTIFAGNMNGSPHFSVMFFLHFGTIMENEASDK